MAVTDYTDYLNLFKDNAARVGGVSVVGGGGGGGSGRLLTGAGPKNYNPASGGIPGVTSPISTVSNNLSDIGSIINSLTDSSSAALRSQYPNEYFAILGQLLGNTQKRAGGDISDLLPELQTNAAESAVAGGVSGSGLANSKLLRDIGLTRYGVENQALKDLGTIQSEIPTVRPYDPNALINAQLDAQERADMYAAAPSPEAAYQRALAASRAGGPPATGWKSGGVTYAPTGGGGGGMPSTTISPWSSQGPVAPQWGTAMNPSGGSPGMPSLPYGSYTGWGSGGGGTEDDFSDVLSLWNNDEPYMAPQTLQNYADFDPWLASMMDVGGGVDFSGGDSFYGGGEDFGASDYGGDYYDEYY